MEVRASYTPPRQTANSPGWGNQGSPAEPSPWIQRYHTMEESHQQQEQPDSQFGQQVSTFLQQRHEDEADVRPS